MGHVGPIPKRSDQVRRTNHKSENIKAPTGPLPVEPPEADPAWHPAALQLWESMAASGQARFYEPSDWGLAYVLMDDLTAYLRSRSRPGVKLSAILSGLGSLLVTEGDRLRVRLELERGTAPDAEDDPRVAIMARYRAQAAG